ncbi:MAG: hypothetical protein FWC92_03980 [Defluviitaleaceae bacterium]|nr:hypothetical protein [Defluviitaleaceae bacterium]
MQVLSGLIVSVDAFFIGLSLGLQKGCKFLYLAVINMFLLGLCIIGYFIAGRVYEYIPFDPDIIVGLAFITLGVWTIVQYFICEYIKRRRGEAGESASLKAIVLVGLVMSIEAMLITMGVTIVFAPYSTFIIPIVVAFAHFAYSSLSFVLARTNFVKRMPVVLSHVLSGLALVIYGLMAIFVEL